MRYLVFYDRSTRNAISRRLREKKDRGISSFTREILEMRYFAVYGRKGNEISRHLREKCKKYDISPFIRK